MPTQTLKVLTILLILISGSGCAIKKGDYIEPLCLPDRPVTYSLSLAEQQAIHSDSLEKIGLSDANLKGHIEVIERITEVHNQQFKAKCAAAL